LTDEASEVVVQLLFGGAEHEVLERLLPGVWSKAGADVDAIRVVTGRTGQEVDRAVLEAAGVRFLTLG
jgi:ribosomal protein L12E/L44/L45/RPP1/RPP2